MRYWLTFDLWFARDNRLLNPKSSYKRIIMAPPCRLIHQFSLTIKIGGAMTKELLIPGIKSRAIAIHPNISYDRRLEE